jgi:hypothetical protein
VKLDALTADVSESANERERYEPLGDELVRPRRGGRARGRGQHALVRTRRTRRLEDVGDAELLRRGLERQPGRVDVKERRPLTLQLHKTPLHELLRPSLEREQLIDQLRGVDPAEKPDSG